LPHAHIHVHLNDCLPLQLRVAGPLRKELLVQGITGGASHVDIEVEAPAEWKEELIALAKKHNVKAIVSHHNYECTPPTTELLRIVEQCFADGADIAKVAVAAKTVSDAARVLGLHGDGRCIPPLSRENRHRARAHLQGRDMACACTVAVDPKCALVLCLLPRS
jgi:hypothetical protein